MPSSSSVPASSAVGSGGPVLPLVEHGGSTAESAHIPASPNGSLSDNTIEYPAHVPELEDSLAQENDPDRTLEYPEEQSTIEYPEANSLYIEGPGVSCDNTWIDYWSENLLSFSSIFLKS